MAAAADANNADLLDLYNQQICNEFEASQLYLAAAVEADGKDLVGMAQYFRHESNEERQHALQLIEFASKRNFPVQLQSVAAPPQAFHTTYELWETLLHAEQANTQALLTLADAALEHHDHALLAFLQPLHMEQVQAEDELGTILAKIKDEQQTPGLLRILDRELAQGQSQSTNSGGK
jgi:ferritin